MKIHKKKTAPRYVRQEGITSYLLTSLRTAGARNLCTTLVEIEPGGEQRVHSHPPEQVYYILDGAGLVTVGKETEEIHSGECVFIPSGTPHGIKNHTEETLRYFSAASPSFDEAELKEWWPLGGEPDSGDSPS
ncbi:MAG: cupin domain-containing protein [Candidatus Neomarinimicrobiota bacterium]